MLTPTMRVVRSLAANRAALIGIALATAAATTARIVAVAASGLVGSQSLITLIGLGALLALVQRALSALSERARERAQGRSRLREVQLVQVLAALVFSIIVSSPIVFGYVEVASVLLLSDALRAPGAVGERGAP
jgi:hypothetical protein